MNKLAKHDFMKLWTYQVSIVSDTGECWRCFRTEKEKLQLLWPQLGSPSTCRQLITNRSDWKVSKLCTGRASTGTASTGRASISKQAQAQAEASSTSTKPIQKQSFSSGSVVPTGSWRESYSTTGKPNSLVIPHQAGSNPLVILRCCSVGYSTVH